MKFLAILATVSVAGAIVLPDASVFEEIARSANEFVDFVSSEAANGVHDLKDTAKNRLEDLLDLEPQDDKEPSAVFETLDHDYSDFTIYELISKSEHTTNFSHIVDKYDDVVKRLNDSDATYTLFVPIDKAFEHIPEHHKKPGKEFLNDLLDYHVGNGSYPAQKILTTHTLPTLLHEELLGGEPQRLRTSVGFGGVRVNVFSKVVAANIKAKNGYIHAVDKIILPPTYIGREISFFPTQFSTLLLAYEKTDFVKFIHGVKAVGITAFVPSNEAWKRLGNRANAFLFNTEQGKKYLKALLKYQLVTNTTVYSDKIYYADEDSAILAGGGSDHFHIELHTLLKDKSLGLDIHTWRGFVSLVLNGYNKVAFPDGIAKNGVIQVTQNVPIPSCNKKGEYYGGEIEVEELKERLDPYVVEEENDWAGEL